jgi:transposase
MKSTQNKKIEQVKESTMIVGIDIGSEKHYFRAFDWRGIELTKKPVPFSNSMEGFNIFHSAVLELMNKNQLTEALVGFEPTGHYWFNLGQFMSDKNIKFVMVNPHHVHKTKEMDDNSPSKNDRKDPRVIANLVKDGRYFYTYMPTGVYAELRNLSNRRFVLVEEQTRAKNRLQKWIAVYFPEYKGIYTNIDAKGGMMVLKEAPVPDDIINLGVEGIQKIWRDAKLRGNGLKKAMKIVNAAANSIGLKEGLIEARMELVELIEDYELQMKRIERVNDLIKDLCSKIKYVDKLLEIKGIGITTVAGFIAEVGDITRFDNAKELQKLAGLELVSDDSGKHNGRTRISKRGRKRLRYLLVQAAVSVIGKNDEFKEIHHYYTTRDNNPLKKMQSLIAVACKLIRVFHVILTKGVDYDASKMLGDIKRPGVADRKAA